MFRKALTVLVAICIACDASSPSPARVTELRDRARLILEANCGSCHLPGLATSLDAALAIYDLSEVEWAARMSELQLRNAEGRLASDLAPGGSDGTPIAVSSDDRAAFKEYVDMELARRAK